MLTKQNISPFAAGDTPTIKITITADAPPAFDPTGATGSWTLYTSIAGVITVKLTKSTADVCTFDTDTEGNVSLWVPLIEADTSTLPAGQYLHTAKVVESNGGRFHVMTGSVTILAVPDA
jgi:chitodextrinase